MPKHTSPTEKDRRGRPSPPEKPSEDGTSLFSWVGGMAERVGVDRVGSYFGVDRVGEMLGAERVGNVLGGAIQSAARTKARLDKNVQLLLAVANLPSKRDYEKVQVKLDALQAGLMTVNSKLDRLYQQLEAAGTQNGWVAGAEDAASTLSERARTAIARSAAAAAGRAATPRATSTKKVAASKAGPGAKKKAPPRARKSAAATTSSRKTTRR